MHDALLLPLAETLTADVSDKVREMRLDAFKVLHKQLRTFQGKGYDEKLIDEIAEKRAAFINQAMTKTEMEKVLHPDYTGTPPYGITAEEIIFWSEASLRYPLRQKDLERYKSLIREFYAR